MLESDKRKAEDYMIKNNLRIISKPNAYLQTMTKTLVKFQKNWYKTVEVETTRCPLSIHFVIDNAWKMAKFNLWKKWQKIIWGLYPNHLHYFQTMTKTPVKFQKNRHKTVGGVAPTRCPLSIHFVIDNAKQMAKFNLWKKWHKIIWGLYPNHMHIFKPWPKHQWSFQRICIKL